jgi:predicted  nucleic acid-binding Zn-ribbon protein
MNDLVKGFRDAIQDLLVPKLGAIEERLGAVVQRLDRAEADTAALRRESNERFETLRQEMNDLRREMNERFANVNERFVKVDERFEALLKEIHGVSQSVANLSGQMDVLRKDILSKLDVVNRVAKVEGEISVLRGQMTLILHTRPSKPLRRKIS